MLDLYLPSLPSVGLVSGTTQAEPCFLFVTSCSAVVVQSALRGMCPPGAGVQAPAAARAAAPAEPAWLCSGPAPRHPKGEGVLFGATQQGFCLTMAQPQAGGVWDQVQHGEMIILFLPQYCYGLHDRSKHLIDVTHIHPLTRRLPCTVCSTSNF